MLDKPVQFKNRFGDTCEMEWMVYVPRKRGGHVNLTQPPQRTYAAANAIADRLRAKHGRIYRVFWRPVVMI